MIEIFIALALMSAFDWTVNIISAIDKNEKIGVGVSCGSFAMIFVLSIACIAFLVGGEYESISPLLGHIDKDKTKTSETNGEITDLWITVDGKEYHFELKQEGENEHDE